MPILCMSAARRWEIRQQYSANEGLHPKGYRIRYIPRPSHCTTRVLIVYCTTIHFLPASDVMTLCLLDLQRPLLVSIISWSEYTTNCTWGSSAGDQEAIQAHGERWPSSKSISIYSEQRYHTIKSNQERTSVCKEERQVVSK
jgi:hypothetical protein